jgi:hypothetical protein
LRDVAVPGRSTEAQVFGRSHQTLELANRGTSPRRHASRRSAVSVSRCAGESGLSSWSSG